MEKVKISHGCAHIGIRWTGENQAELIAEFGNDLEFFDGKYVVPPKREGQLEIAGIGDILCKVDDGKAIGIWPTWCHDQYNIEEA